MAVLRIARLAFVLALCAGPAPAGVTGLPDRLPPELASRARFEVAQTLGAPQTANFRKIGGFRLSDGGWAVCGEVNSRNRTGLAMGWKPIYLRYRPEGAGLVLARRIVDWPANAACRRLAMGWSVGNRG
jgi:hypothetical protein